jgi:hypothetical protein
VKGLIFFVALVALVLILAKSPVSAVPDNDTSPTHKDISNQEITINQTQASNSSASATITITMYTGDGE